MQIIVNDTNILIDLYSVGLLGALCELPYDVRTVDFVTAEIIVPEQSDAIDALVKENLLRVEGFNTEEVAEIMIEHSGVPGNISFTDCAVCFYAKKHSALLLTGDRQLRKYAEASTVVVRGILFIFDELVEHALITRKEAAEKLQRLLVLNVRLPKSEIEKRIVEWTKAGGE